MPKKKYYAVANGHKPGLYDAWFGTHGAEVQVKGYPQALYKSFPTSAEAKEWLNEMAGRKASTFPKKSTPKTAVKAHQSASSNDYEQLHQKALSTGKIVIYTDGGCEGNPGIGGYGAVILSGEGRQELSDGYAHTTNNRMELMACIASLSSLGAKASVMLFSDSAYTINGIQKGWAVRWRANGWRRREGQEFVPVKNADLWQQLLELCEYHGVEFVKVKGHSGVPENERCDQLSSEMMQRTDLPVDTGYES